MGACGIACRASSHTEHRRGGEDIICNALGWVLVNRHPIFRSTRNKELLDKQPWDVVSANHHRRALRTTPQPRHPDFVNTMYRSHITASMRIPRAGLNGLPLELICEIFWMVIDSEKPRKERCRLMLVCRQWREYVEDSALLWTTISAQDGLPYMRRALKKSRGVMIDFYYPLSRSSAANLKAFMAEVSAHIPQWRSLMIAPPSQRPLEGFISTNPITLFGRAPAPSTLKNLTLDQIPVAFEPLGLSGLVSLDLQRVPTISTLQLLEILRDSPGLERLRLDGNPRLVVIGSQASNSQPIELPKLVSLSLRRTNNSGMNCILSNIRLPKSRHCVSIHANMSGVNPRSVLFTSAISHILHATIPTPDLPSSVITVRSTGYENGTIIKFRDIELALVLDGEDSVRDILGWFADGLRSEAAECPVHLLLDSSKMDPVRLAAVRSPLVVKHLSISDSISKSSKEALYKAMVRAPDPSSSDWFLPQMETFIVEVGIMESFSFGFGAMESQKQLISMLRNRYEGGKTELRCPMNLRSVGLLGELRPGGEGLMEEIKWILGEVDVFWAGRTL